MSKYAVKHRQVKLSQDDLRPNTTNNFRRPWDASALLSDANPDNHLVQERARAMSSLKNMSLDGPNKIIMYNDQNQMDVVLLSAAPCEPESVRVQALGVMKHLSFDLEIREKAYLTNQKFHDRTLEALKLDEPTCINIEGFRIMSNLSMSECNHVQMYDDACWMLASVSVDEPMEIRRDAFTSLRRLTFCCSENRIRLWEEISMRRCLLAAAAPQQPASIREQALRVVGNLALEPVLGVKLWTRVDGVRDLLLEAASIEESVPIQEASIIAIANLAAYEKNQEHMFECAHVQLGLLAGSKRAACVRAHALRAFQLCTEIDAVKRKVGVLWSTDSESIRWLIKGAAKVETNDVRIAALTALGNLATLEENRQSMWRTEWFRDVVLEACQPIVIPGIPTKNTPAIEQKALEILEILTGVSGSTKW
jgi:hypothetical protein